MSGVRRIEVIVRVEVPEQFTDEAAMNNIRGMLTSGITDEVNDFFEDEAPGVHVTYCATTVEP